MTLNSKQQTGLVVGLILLLLLVDQLIKVYVKLNFTIGEVYEVFPWFLICFVENDGMAFGIEWFDKLFLTLFRIVAVGLFSYYLHKLIKSKARLGYIVMVALITAGALGNIIDCVLYGQLFSESTPLEVATFMPDGGGYAPLFYGKVVDMLYFPLIHNSAGETIFFRPVFNFADSLITVSVIVVFLFYTKDLNKSLSKDEQAESKVDEQQK